MIRNQKYQLTKVIICLLLALIFSFNAAFAAQEGSDQGGGNNGAIWTTDSSGGEQDSSSHDIKQNVFLNGHQFEPSIPLFVRVTNESGGTILGISPTAVITPDANGVFGPVSLWNAVESASGVQGYLSTVGNYKVWVSSDSGFPGGTTKTDLFRVDNDPGSIQINKTFIDTAQATAAAQRGVTFTLSGDSLQTPLTGTTDSAGRINFNNLAPGTYILTETVPEGYTSSIGNPASKSIVVAAGSAIVENVLNTKSTVTPTVGSITVNKTYKDNDNMTPIAQVGVTFTLSGNNLQTPLTGITDSAGRKNFNNLAPGTYTLTETVPLGYTSSLGNPASKSIVVVAGGAIIENVLNTKVIVTPTTGSITINKTYKDNDNATPAAQARVTFKLSGNGIEGDWTKITDSAGIVIYSDLTPGTYMLTEVVPEGYSSSLGNTASKSIVVAAGDTIVEDVLNTKNIVTPTSGSITVNKTYKDNAEAAEAAQAGVTFTLSGNSLQTPLTGITDSAGSINFSNLSPGTYTLTENVPEGYASSLGSPASKSIVVAAGDAVVEDVLNTKNIVTPTVGSITVNKTYKNSTEATPAAQAGVTFTLSGNGMEGSLTGTTDAAGRIIFSDLTPGTYTLTENVPAGYTSSLGNPASKNIVVEAGGAITENVLNTKNIVTPTPDPGPSPDPDPGPTTGSITVNKTYKDSAEAAAAAQAGVNFTLSKAGSEAILTGTTDLAGNVTFRNLIPGTYTMTEIIPEGYTSSLGTPASKSIVVTAGATISENVLNTKTIVPPEKPEVPITEELPKTGGNTAAYLLGGSALTGLGFILRRLLNK